MNNTADKESGLRKTRIGGISLISLAIVVAVVIIVNLAVGKLPAKYTKYSISSMGLYDMTENSEKIIKDVKDKINLYVVAETSGLDNVTYEYCKRVESLNANITVTHVDPVLQPAFVAAYTDEALSSAQTHIIVDNPALERSKVINYSEIYYQKYTEQEAYYYQMMGYDVDTSTYFDIEARLVNAIDYVTTDDLPVVYYTSGHQEYSIDSDVSKLIEDENITLNDLPLLTAESVPEDADLVIIYSPELDFQESEINALKDYFENGGKILLVSSVGANYAAENLSNLYGFAAQLGLGFSGKLVCEGSAAHYYQYPYYIIPQVASNAFSSSLGDNTNILMPFAHEILISDAEDVTTAELMTTSLMGYAVSVVDREIVKDEERGDGKAVIGAMSTKGEGSFIWFSSRYIMDGSTVGYFSNVTYFMSMLTEVCGKSTTVTADAKSLQVEALTIPEASSNLWGTVMIVIIPLITVAAGFVVWFRRTRQ
ncbi:MAG: Gldg family protein [Clostridia bacterium]|nr:Gldg family protein [Clostridia bacterium]